MSVPSTGVGPKLRHSTSFRLVRIHVALCSVRPRISLQEHGNAGWSYADVLPYFKKAEDQEYGASEYRGVGGPLHVIDQPGSNRSHVFIEAGRELGWPLSDDFQGASQEGVCILQMTIREGGHESTAASYLRPALLRSNLTVLTKALVTRVLFEGKRAIGS